MEELPVLGPGPIGLSTAEGKQLLVPLGALYFDAEGLLKADRWPDYAANQELIDTHVARLAKAGLLRAGGAPAARPAMLVEAITAGGSGVVIEIEIADVVAAGANPPASVAEFTVRETDTYQDIELDELDEVLGETPGEGTRPGLVFVSGGAAAEMPKAGVYPMAAAAAGDAATVEIPNTAEDGIALTLETRSAGEDAEATEVEIADVDAATETLTLIVRWEKSAQVAMTELADTFGHVVKITAPEGGFRAPTVGKWTLGGGSDAVATEAVKASAVIQAG